MLKKVYIDIYHPLEDNKGFPTKNVIHLKAIDIQTDINIDEVVSKLTELILEYYGDGLRVEAEEFEEFCYINVFLMFGKEYKFLVDYLYSINLKESENTSQIKNIENIFLSIDYFFDENDRNTLIKELNDLVIEAEFYLINRKRFERGAGDYHELIMLAIKSSISGAGTALGKILMDKLVDIYDDYQNPRIHKVNTEKVLEFISREVDINKADLKIYSVKNLKEPFNEKGKKAEKMEILITSRYKNIQVICEKNSKITSYEVENKTQTMI